MAVRGPLEHIRMAGIGSLPFRSTLAGETRLGLMIDDR
jgi:hypothetical protein